MFRRLCRGSFCLTTSRLSYLAAFVFLCLVLVWLFLPTSWEFTIMVRSPLKYGRTPRICIINGNIGFYNETGECQEMENAQVKVKDDIGLLESQDLPRVLCWILCDEKDLYKRVMHVRDTWAKHCDVSLFMSAQENKDFPTIGLNVTEGRDHIASKSKAAWTYVYNHHYNDADFFMKADPDTYVIMENLKDYLKTRDSSKPEFYGHQLLDPYMRNESYMSGGPGLILTKESLKRLVSEAFKLEKDCMPDGQSEDLKSGKCLRLVGSHAVDTRDSEGKSRFIIFNPKYHLFPNSSYPAWYIDRDGEGAVLGPNCCSEYPISFHYVSNQEMYALDYFLYRLKRHGHSS